MTSDRSRLLELVLLVSGCAGIGALLDGVPLWLAGAVLATLTAYGTFAILVRHEPRGVPVESLAPPAVAAVGALGATHLAGPGPFAVAALAAGAVLLAASVSLERRLLGPADEVSERRRNQLAQLGLLLAFFAFVGTAGAVPGGLVEPGTGPAPLDEAGLLLLAAADAIVAFLLGYRLSAVRVVTVRDAAIAGGTFAGVVAIAAAVIRALALPRLIAPALLAVVFALWSAYRAAPRSERRTMAWLWEYGLLALAGAATVAWNLLLR